MTLLAPLARAASRRAAPRRAASRFAVAALVAFVAVVAFAALSASVARAAEPPSPKRETPDYHGRPDPAPSAGEVALWVPRVVLFPLYLVSEYVLRRPFGALITTAERNNWAETLIDIFTFDPLHKSGLVPTAFFDFGLQPSVGLYFFWNDALFAGHDVRAHVSYFGSDWLAVAASERFHVTKTSRMGIDAKWVRRPDYEYFGEGARTPQEASSRYLAMTLDVGPSWDLHPAHGVSYTAHAGVRNVFFHSRPFAGDPSVLDSVSAGRFEAPSHFYTGYTALYERVELALDSRPGEDAPQTGVRALAHVEHGTDLRASPGSSWIKYGGTVGAFADVWQRRTFALSVTAEFADPLRGGAIPFTEEVVWGGDEPLSGYIPGRFHGRSAAAATVGYTWPIWVWLEGRMTASLGNVFDAGLADLKPGLLRASAGIGFQSTGSPDHRLEVLVGFGTETFDQGAKVDSFRLVFGGTHGF
jgi:hypothetical protein